MKYYIIYDLGYDGLDICSFDDFDIAYYHFMNDFHVVKMIKGSEFDLKTKSFF